MTKIALFLANGTEEGEAIIHIDLYRRAGFEVTTFSIEEDSTITSAHDVKIVADDHIDNINTDEFDMLFVPGGGGGVENMYKSEKLSEVLTTYASKGGNLGAVCAGPTVLARLGILDGVDATVFPGWEDRLTGANHVDEAVVVAGNIVTGRGLGACIPQALKIIELFTDRENAEKIAMQIVFTGEH